VKPSIGTLITDGNEIVKTKTDLLNLYFTTQSTLNDTPRALPPLFMTTPHRQKNVTTSPVEVEHLISILHISKVKDLTNSAPDF